MAAFVLYVRCFTLFLVVSLVSGQACVQSGTTLNGFNSYTCNDASITTYASTFTAASFTTPEEIHIVSVTSKQLPVGAFANMGTIQNNVTFGASNNTTFPKLSITCLANNFLHISNGTFDGLDYIEWFAIRRCLLLGLPDAVFAGLGTLYSLELSGGEIGSLASKSFEGLTILSDSTVFGAGSVNLTSRLPTNSEVPANLFAPLDGVTHLNLQGMGISNIVNTAFGIQSKLVFLNLTDNLYINLKDGSFDGLAVLSELEMYNVRFTCDCNSVWLITWAEANHAKLKSDYRCVDAATSLAKYKKDNCDKSPIGFMLLSNYWFGLEKISLWLLNILSLCLACAALAHVRKAGETPKPRRRPPAKDHRKPRPKGLKRAADKVRRMQRKMNLGWG